MPPQNAKKVNLDELAAGKLPERVINAIGEMELSVAEVAQWESSKPVIRVGFRDDWLRIDIRLRIPIKKTIAVGSVGGLLLAAAKLIFWYLSKFHGGPSIP